MITKHHNPVFIGYFQDSGFEVSAYKHVFGMVKSKGNSKEVKKALVYHWWQTTF